MTPQETVRAAMSGILDALGEDLNEEFHSCFGHDASKILATVCPLYGWRFDFKPMNFSDKELFPYIISLNYLLNYSFEHGIEDVRDELKEQLSMLISICVWYAEEDHNTFVGVDEAALFGTQRFQNELY